MGRGVGRTRKYQAVYQYILCSECMPTVLPVTVGIAGFNFV